MFRMIFLLIGFISLSSNGEGNKPEINKFKSIQSDSIRLENIYKIVDDYSSTNELLFEKYNEEYRSLATKYKSNYHLGAVERRYSNYYKKKQNYQKALEHSFKALQYDQLANEHLAITADYVNIASIFVKTEQYNKAFETYDKTFCIIQNCLILFHLEWV